MRLVIHAADQNAEICIEGRGFSIPPGVPFEVSQIQGTDHMTSDYQYVTDEKAVTEEMVRSLWHMGLVEIPVKEVKGQRSISFEFDVPKALAEAKARLIKSEERMLSDYVAQCRALISDNKAAQPPSPRVDGIIKKLGIDLKAKYGITPIGYDAVAAGYAKNDELDAMKARAEKAERATTDLTARFDKLMAQLEGDPKKAK